MAKDRDDEDELPDGPESDVPMSFFDHLGELRKRLVRSALGIAISFVACYIVVDHLAHLILIPFRDAWVSVGMEGPAELQNLSALEAFLTDLRIAVMAALFVAGPVVFYQGWMFIAPGLYKREKSLVVPFVATSAVMFAGGAVFCYMFVLPVATEFFLQYTADKQLDASIEIVARFTYADYIQYATRLLLGFGLMFEFPLGVFFLAKAGIISHKTLLRYWKPMILVFFVVGALLTPPEPITQVLMAGPMVGLYFASVGVAYIVGKDERERMAELEKRLAEEDDEGEGDDEDEDE